jgi:AraC family transcriptional regulator
MESAVQRLRERTIGPFRIDETRYAGGQSMPRHLHETHHLSCLVGGTFSEGLGTKDYTRTRGTAIFRRAGAEHSCDFGKRPVRVLRVQFDDAWLARVEQASTRTVTSTTDQSIETGALIERLQREIYDDSPYSTLATEGLILELIANALRAKHTVERGSPAWLRDVRERIHESFVQPPPLADIAAEAGVHPSHLARTFRNHYGCTIGEYARRLRVQDAMTRLRSSEDPLADIAHLTGFADQAHFTRQFRRATGQTPGQFRRAMQSR